MAFSGSRNPFERYVENRILNTLIKSGSSSSYYTILNLDKSAKSTDISKAYKKLSLQLHPDKIQQSQRRAPTESEKEKLLQIKHAYNVLNDPSRRKRYNQVGDEGLQLLEGGISDLQGTLLKIMKNLSNNRGDRNILLLILLTIICIVISAPILLCLKADNHSSMSKTKWSEVWIPIWIIDFFLLISVASGLPLRPKDNKNTVTNMLKESMLKTTDDDNDDDNDNDDDDEDTSSKQEWFEAIIQFISTISHITFQILFVRQMDSNSNFDFSYSSSPSSSSWPLTWIEVVMPLLLYELIYIYQIYQKQTEIIIEDPEVLLTKHEEFQTHMRDTGGNENENDIENDNDKANIAQQLNEEALLQKLMIINMKKIQKKSIRVQLCFTIYYILFFIFIALKLDNNIIGNWSWNAVMSPIWAYLITRLILYYIFSNEAKLLKDGIDMEALIKGEIKDVQQYATGQHGEDIDGMAFALLCCSIWPIITSVLLLVSLDGTDSDISWFWIITPVWAVLLLITFIGLCACCFFSCCIDSVTNDMEMAMNEQQEELAKATASGAFTPPNSPSRNQDQSQSQSAASSYIPVVIPESVPSSPSSNIKLTSMNGAAAEVVAAIAVVEEVQVDFADADID